MKTIKYQNGTVGTITYEETEKGILKLSIFETVDGWATMKKEYISDKKELNKWKLHLKHLIK